jgi:hypothetical protein
VETGETKMNNEPFIWLKQDFDGEWIEVHPNKGIPLYTTPQIKELSDEEIKLIKGVVSDYVCTLKMEIDQQKQAFKGYEHCSNLDGLNDELKDSEQALAILKKASEK